MNGEDSYNFEQNCKLNYVNHVPKSMPIIREIRISTLDNAWKKLDWCCNPHNWRLSKTKYKYLLRYISEMNWHFLTRSKK